MEKTRVLLFLSFMTSLLMAVLTPVIPVYAVKLGASQFEVGLLGGAIAAVYSLTTLSLSAFTRRIGCRKPVLTSLSILSLTYILYSLCKTPLHLVLTRVVEGVGWSLFWPFTEALLAQGGSNSKSAASFSVWWSLGSVLGALTSGLALKVQEPVVFLATAFTFALLAVLGFLYVREVFIEEGEGTPSVKVALASYKVAWFAVFTYALVQGIFFTFLPAHATLKGIPALFIGLSIFLLMGARTLAFWLLGLKPFRFKRVVIAGATLLLMGSLPLFFSINTLNAFLSCFTVGFGAGLLYVATLSKVFSVKHAHKGVYTCLFEGVLGVGYLVGPVMGGVVAERVLTGVYIVSALFPLTLLILIFYTYVKGGGNVCVT